METISISNIKGIVSESLSDPDTDHHRAYRVTCTMCGETKMFKDTETVRGTATFEAYMLYKIGHRKQHPFTTKAKQDAYGTEGLF